MFRMGARGSTRSTVAISASSSSFLYSASGRPIQRLRGSRPVAASVAPEQIEYEHDLQDPQHRSHPHPEWGLGTGQGTDVQIRYTPWITSYDRRLTLLSTASASPGFRSRTNRWPRETIKARSCSTKWFTPSRTWRAVPRGQSYAGGWDDEDESAPSSSPTSIPRNEAVRFAKRTTAESWSRIPTRGSRCRISSSSWASSSAPFRIWPMTWNGSIRRSIRFGVTSSCPIPCCPGTDLAPEA